MPGGRCDSIEEYNITLSHTTDAIRPIGDTSCIPFLERLFVRKVGLKKCDAVDSAYKNDIGKWQFDSYKWLIPRNGEDPCVEKGLCTD